MTNATEPHFPEDLDKVRVEIALPSALMARLDREAKRLGITQQALVLTVVADRLDAAA